MVIYADLLLRQSPPPVARFAAFSSDACDAAVKTEALRHVLLKSLVSCVCAASGVVLAL